MDSNNDYNGGGIFTEGEITDAMRATDDLIRFLPSVTVQPAVLGIRVY